MHPYAIDSDERKIVPFGIAFVSVLAALALNRMFYILHFVPPWWIDAPSAMGFYELIYTLFNKCFWKSGCLRKIGLVKAPDLNGVWNGTVKSSFNNYNPDKSVEATLRITQNWTQISIALETHYSKSRSLAATVITQDPHGVTLSYEYLNEPHPNAKSTMHAHRGTAILTLQSNGEVLEGEYYTGRGRGNFGILKFEKTS